jgi:hypothetical protein
LAWWPAGAIAQVALAEEPPPPPDLLRLHQPLSVVHYSRVEDRIALPPVTRGRARSGPIDAWVWPDGTIARYRRYKGRSVVEDHRFDASGIPWATVRLGPGGPTAVEVANFPPAIVTVSDWKAIALGPASIRGPGAPIQVDGKLQWAAPTGALSAGWLEGSVDPTTRAFEEGISEGCGCLLSARGTALADGTEGVTWTIRAPHPTEPGIGEIFAFPRDGGVLVLSWATHEQPAETHPELAPGRAAVALLTWERQR